MGMSGERSSPTPVPPVCAVCGVKVGVYEPAVFVHARWAVRSARAVRPELLRRGDTVIVHEHCYEERPPIEPAPEGG